MAAAAVAIPFIPVGEYLGSVYRPDVDYVDGVLEERNVGEFDHAEVQNALLRLLSHLREQGIRAVPELRVQVAEGRYRIPDVCVLPSGWKKTQIVREAPALCMEVLSPRDTVRKMRQRAQDYIAMGVPEVWIFDPSERRVFVLNSAGLTEPNADVLRLEGSPIIVNLQDVFAVLDE